MARAKDVTKLESLDIGNGSLNGTATLENNLAIPQKVKIVTVYDPGFSFVGVYLKELKAGTQADSSRPMSTNKQINKSTKMWYVHIYIQSNTIQPLKGIRF